MQMVKVSIFCLIIYVIWQVPSLAPKQVTAQPIIKNQVVEQVKAVEPIIADSATSPQLEAEPSIEQMIRDAFGKDADKAVALSKCESGMNPESEGDINTPYHSIGLFQIRLLPGRGITADEMLNPAHNIEYAKMLFDKSGFTPWHNCSKKLGL